VREREMLLCRMGKDQGFEGCIILLDGRTCFLDAGNGGGGRGIVCRGV
jgi:hypothetical protein